MNNTPIKQPNGPVIEPQATELSSPHFDDIAVLIAQPVEPIAVEAIAPRERNWFAMLEKPRMMIAALVVAGLLATTAVALTLQLRREPGVKTAAAEIQTEEAKPESKSSQSDSPLGASIGEEELSALRAKPQKARSRSTTPQTKPVARRIGVIVYGRSSGRP